MSGKRANDDSDVEAEEEEEEEEYVVEKILDKRLRAGKVEYFLKWKGYSEEDNTWEPEENLECQDLIQAFLEKEKQKTQKPEKEKEKPVKTVARKEKPVEAEKPEKAAALTSVKKRDKGEDKEQDEPSSTSTSASGKKKARRDPAGPKGFDRDLEPEKIIGATDANGELSFLMKWKDSEEADMVKAEDANKRCPQVVIKFYEDRLTWQSTSTENNGK